MDYEKEFDRVEWRRLLGRLERQKTNMKPVHGTEDVRIDGEYSGPEAMNAR